MLGDLGVGQSVEAVEHEGVPAQGRKFGESGPEPLQAFGAERGFLGIRRGSGEMLRDIVDVFVAAMGFLAQVIDDQVGRRPEKKGARLADGRRRGIGKHSEVDFLSQVGRIGFAHFSAQKTEEVVGVAEEPMMDGGFG